MSKVKGACIKVGSAIKSGWHNANKIRIMRFLAFCAGFLFNILGIIGVAVWKYIFCSDENKCKYCIRLSIFGMLTEIILCTKCLFVTSVPMYDYSFPMWGNDFMNSANKMISRNMRDFDREFARIEKKMARDKRMLERQIEDAVKSNHQPMNNNGNINVVACEGDKCKDVTPEVKRTRSEKDGWINETITETTPHSYMQISTSSYDSRRDKTKGGKYVDGKNKKNEFLQKKDEKKLANKYAGKNLKSPNIDNKKPSKTAKKEKVSHK